MRWHCRVLVLVLLTLTARPLSAWEAKVFPGEGGDAVDADLRVHRDDAGSMFYSEDFTFTFSLKGKAAINLKVGMSKVLAGEGSAFAQGSIRIKGKGGVTEKISATYAKGKWSATDEPFLLKLPNLSLGGNASRLELKLDGKKLSGDLVLEAAVPGFRPGNGRIEFEQQGYVSFVVWPKMKVSGTVTDKATKKKHKVSGTCIFTHAASTVAPQHMPDRWFYFKSKDRANPVLFQGFQLSEAFGGKSYGWLLAVSNDAYLVRTSRLEVNLADQRETSGKSLPWALYLKAVGEELEGAVQATELNGVQERLGRVPKVQAAIIRQFVNPKQHSFKAALELALKGKKLLLTEGEYRLDTIH